MAWSPRTNIITARAIPDNLVTYCLDATRQRDALTWAGGTTLKLIKTAQNSLAERDKPIYPCIAFANDEDAQDAEDMITAVYPVTFELRIQNSDPDDAVTNARKYAKAFMSMLANCPISTLIANTGANSAAMRTMETKFEPIKAHTERKNDFRQDVTIRSTFELHGVARN